MPRARNAVFWLDLAVKAALSGSVVAALVTAALLAPKARRALEPSELASSARA